MDHFATTIENPIITQSLAAAVPTLEMLRSTSDHISGPAEWLGKYTLQQVSRTVELHPLNTVAHAQPPASSESEGEDLAEPFWKKFRDQASVASQKARKYEHKLTGERTKFQSTTRELRRQLKVEKQELQRVQKAYETLRNTHLQCASGKHIDAINRLTSENYILNNNNTKLRRVLELQNKLIGSYNPNEDEFKELQHLKSELFSSGIFQEGDGEEVDEDGVEEEEGDDTKLPANDEHVTDFANRHHRDDGDLDQK
jgi:hypothetical protein